MMDGNRRLDGGDNCYKIAAIAPAAAGGHALRVDSQKAEAQSSCDPLLDGRALAAADAKRDRFEMSPPPRHAGGVGRGIGTRFARSGLVKVTRIRTGNRRVTFIETIRRNGGLNFLVTPENRRR